MVCPAPLELLVNVVKSVLAVQVVLLAHPVSVVHPEDEVCLEPMALLDLKVFIGWSRLQMHTIQIYSFFFSFIFV